jgi:micrococcal nuclease
MGFIFFLIFIFSLTGLIVGLVKPAVFKKIIKKVPRRKTIIIVFSIAMIISFFAFGSTLPQTEKEDETNIVANSNQSNEQQSSAGAIANDNETRPTEQNTEQSTTNGSAQTQTQQTAPKTESTADLFSVMKVVDGDTIKVNINGTVETIRLIGINTPETVDPRKSVECFGVEASNKAKELLTGKKVRLENDSTQGERDKYGRLLRYVWMEDGTFFNKKMIGDGYAHEYTYNVPYKYQKEFKQAQAEAESAKRGLWADDACNITTSNATSPIPPTTEQSTGKYYTSSYHTSKYYYPASCPDWQNLSPSYLKMFDSLEALLAAYPSRTLSPQCQ